MAAHAVGRMILRVLGGLLVLIPRVGSLVVGSAVGRLLSLLGWKRSLIRSNLLLAFPGATADALDYRARLESGFYRHFGSLVVELLCQFGNWRRWVLENVEISGLEHWEAAHARGKGVIFITSHLGNWEAMAAGFCVAGTGADRDLLIVTKHLKPEWLHQSFQRNRLKAGVRGTYEPKTMREVLRELSRNGTVGFVLDQYAGAPIGVRVPFFGIPVGTLLAPAVVARRTGAAVLPAYCYRDSNGRLKVRVGNEFSWQPAGNSHEELARNTALWVSSIEESVRSHPEQWLWSHRRFKGDLSPLLLEEWSASRERT